MNALLQLMWAGTSAAVCSISVTDVTWKSCSWLSMDVMGSGFLSLGVSSSPVASSQCVSGGVNSSCTDWKIFDSTFSGTAVDSFGSSGCPTEGYALTSSSSILLRLDPYHAENPGSLNIHYNCDTVPMLGCSATGNTPISVPARPVDTCASLDVVTKTMTESAMQQSTRLEVTLSKPVNTKALSPGWLTLVSEQNPTLASLLSRGSTGNIVQSGGTIPNTTLYIQLGSLSLVNPLLPSSPCPDLNHFDIFREESIQIVVNASILVPPSNENITATFTITPSVGSGVLSIMHPPQDEWPDSSSTTVSLMRRNTTILQLSLCTEDLYDDQLPPPMVESSMDWLADYLNSEIRFQRWTRYSPKVAHFVLPAVPHLGVTGNSSETITFKLSPLSSSGFVSGLLPELQGTANETGFIMSLMMECESPYLDDCSGCIANYNFDGEGFCKECPACEHGKCAPGPKCECDAGYEGTLCNLIQDSAITGAVAGGSVVASVALEVALGGSLVAPIHSLTFLQLLYMTGSNTCTKQSARSSLLSLRVVVFPLSISATGDEFTDYFLGTLILHSGITLLAFLVLGIKWIITPTVYRRFRDAAGQVYFPNLLILLLYISTVPLLAGFFKAAGEGTSAIVVVGGIWCFANVIGYGVFLYWFLRKKLNTDTGRTYYVEYLEINMGNSFTNATCAISSPRRKHVMPSWLIVWLPTGHWCCRHLRDRLFMKKYALVFDDLLPRSVSWYPVVSFYRIVLLSIISSASSDGCEPRIAIIVILSILYLAYLVKTKPYKSSGTNLAVILSHLFFCLAIASFVIHESLTSWMLISLAVVVTATALWTGIVFIITRNRYDPVLSEQAAADDHNADMECPPKVAGTITVFHKSKLSDSAEIVLSRTKDCGERVWCELRGSLLLIFKKSGEESSEYSTKHNDVIVLHEVKAIPLGDLGFAICHEDNSKQGKVTAFACDKESEADNWLQMILQSLNGSSLTVSGDAEAQLPKVDRIYDYDFFGKSIKTSHGKLRHCNVRGGSEHLLLASIDKSTLTASQRRNVATEIIILSKLKSDFLVRVSCPFETEAEICWVMPFQSGGNLAYHLEMSGKMREQEAAFWTAEAVLALDHLHANRIVFRNLAPVDILFSQGGHLLLANPGLPVALTDEKKVAYVAPEVLKYSQPSPSSDFWSLGCILFEMIHNRRAFDGNSRSVTANLILKGGPRVDVGCSSSLKKILSSLISKDSRPSRTSEIKDFAWFADQNISWSLLEDRTTPPPFLVAGPDPPVREGSVKLVNPLAFTFSGSKEDTQFSTFDADADATVSSPAPLLPSSSSSAMRKQANE